jgi:hypothetical protein
MNPTTTPHKLLTTTLVALAAAAALALPTAANAADGDSTIAIGKAGAATTVRTDDGGTSATRADELDLQGISLPKRRRDQVVRLLRGLDASGRSGHSLVNVLRREGPAVRVADLSSIGAWGYWSNADGQLVLDIGLLRGDGDRTARIGVLAHEIGHIAWDRRDLADRVTRTGAGPEARLLLNETYADAISDQVSRDLGGTGQHVDLWHDFLDHLRSDFYRDYYGIGPREAARARDQAPAALRYLADPLENIGVDHRYVVDNLPR